MLNIIEAFSKARLYCEVCLWVKASNLGGQQILEAGWMFTYINENFLHAPSTDLSRDTVKTLININLAQAQEVFLEKQIADGKKSGMLAKLAAQAALLYTQAVEGLQENSTKGVFDKSWLTMCSVCLRF